jgi:dTMP kinase
LGLFISFEGGEGCGKSTHSRLLLKKLEQRNIPAVLTHEPGGTVLGDELRSLLKTMKGPPISARAELFLLAASRAQLVAEVIAPALKEDKVVICDRFTHSTMVYQGYGRGLDFTAIRMVNNMATRHLGPDLTILLDIAPEEGLARKRSLKDRFELENLSFHRRVREGYLRMADAEPDRWLVIDASLAKARVADIIWGEVSALLPQVSS